MQFISSTYIRDLNKYQAFCFYIQLNIQLNLFIGLAPASIKRKTINILRNVKIMDVLK